MSDAFTRQPADATPEPMALDLARIAQWLPGARLVGDAATVVARVHTDTRSLGAGDLFVALKGERFDANDFLAEARAKGAVAAIATHGLEAAGLPGLEVPDTLAALGALAARWRAQFELPLVAVTGSNGKTTVTQMIASILRAAAGAQVLATQGNLNNEIGLPLTLLRLRASHRLGVVELGMNHVGEIGRLSAIARPTIALVNNAQREHQEFMQSVAAVAQENAQVFAALPDNGTAVFPHGDEFTTYWNDFAREGATRRCLNFGESPEADITLRAAEATALGWRLRVGTPLGEFEADLGIAGRHNLRNALAATACAMSAGVSLEKIAEGLAAFEPVKGRSRARELAFESGRRLVLVDDSYNANPDSVRAAIEALAALPSPRLLVLGDMGEVGDRGPEFHAEVGAWARAQGIEALFGLGDATAHAVRAYADAAAARASSGPATGLHFDDIEELKAAVRERLPATGGLLVKGSRFMRMERVVEDVLGQVPTTPNERSAAVPNGPRDPLPC